MDAMVTYYTFNKQSCSLIILFLACTCPDQFDDCSLVTGECSGCLPLTLGTSCENCIPNTYRDENSNCTVVVSDYSNYCYVFFCSSPVCAILLEAPLATRAQVSAFVKVVLKEIIVTTVVLHTSTYQRLGVRHVNVA